MRLRPFQAAALAVSACALLSSAPASAQAMELAVQDDATILYRTHFDRDVALDRAKAVGATSVRLNVIWDRVAPAPDEKVAPAAVTYDFSRYQDAVAAIRAHGMKAQLTLTGTAPAWATGNGARGAYKPKPAMFAEFARQAAVAFNGQVQAISVWNEPNWPTSLAPQKTAGAQYRTLYRQAYTQIKKVSNIPVWIGELAATRVVTRTAGASTAPLRFLRSTLCVDGRYHKRSCPGLKADGVALHPYMLRAKPTHKPAGRDDVTIGVLHRMTAALRKFRRLRALRTASGKQPGLYLTEFGYLTSGKKGVTPARQAAWVTQSITLARRSGARQLLLYQIVDSGDPALWNSGLLNADGTSKPLYDRLLKRRYHAAR